MEKKINIAELLKDCPKGMELDCTMYDNCTFDGIEDVRYIEILVKTPSGRIRLTKEGCYVHNNDYAKCVIFPKGKTTWEGFQRPFKDGDIIYNRVQHKICIYYLCEDTICINHCRYNECKNIVFEKLDAPIPIVIKDYRFATEKEQQKLFDAIKANGYKWNAETKTLERLDKPIFNIGDWVTDGFGKCQICFIDNNKYWYSVNCVLGSIESVNRKYHLWTIQDAKDGDVLYSPHHHLIWIYKDNKSYYACLNINYATKNVSIDGSIGIPKDACPATKGEKIILFEKIEEMGYKWNNETRTLVKPKFNVGDKVRHISAYTSGLVVKVSNEGYYIDYPTGEGVCYIDFTLEKDYELALDKFDITTLKPFESKVLVRDKNTDEWRGHFFSHYHSNSDRPYVCIGVKGINEYKKCIPYKNNEHLLGKTDDCDEFYKTWE